MVLTKQLPGGRVKRGPWTASEDRVGSRWRLVASRSRDSIFRGGGFLGFLLLLFSGTPLLQKSQGYQRLGGTPACIFIASAAGAGSSGHFAVLNQGFERGAHRRRPGL